MPTTTLTGTHVLVPADADLQARLDFLRQRDVALGARLRTRAQWLVDAAKAVSDSLGYGRPPLAVTTATLPQARAGVPYMTLLMATGGMPAAGISPYTWRIASGALPAGLALAADGRIAGTPVAATPTPVSATVEVTDSAANTARATLTLSVDPATPAPPPLTFTPPALPAARVGTAFTHTLGAAGGTPPYSWSLAGGTLPPGLTLTAATGQLSGTPTTGGTFAFNVRVADAAGQAAQAALSLAVTAAPTPDPLARPVLARANFRYLGAFAMPGFLPSGLSTAFSRGGLTHRRIGGRLRFLAVGQTQAGGQIYEVEFPGLAAGGALPSAPLVREWGDVYGGKKWVENEGGISELSGGVWTYGLHYDEARKRLYWNYGHWYNQPYPFNPSFGYSELDDATGQVRAFGPWRLADRPEKMTRGGCLRIPKWFADRFTGGKDLGVGFGGYFSIAGTGASMGPAMAAAADPDPARDAARSGLVHTPLVGYPFGGPVRCHRNPDYRTGYEDGGVGGPGPFQGGGAVGHWTWNDSQYGAAAWIDLPGVHGVVFLAKVGMGWVRYENATTKAERGRYDWFVYDPKDLADVAQGRKNEWEVQPKSFWADPDLPLSPLDVDGWEGDGHGQVTGATFDPVDGRLYVMHGATWNSAYEWHPQVSCWQLSA